MSSKDKDMDKKKKVEKRAEEVKKLIVEYHDSACAELSKMVDDRVKNKEARKIIKEKIFENTDKLMYNNYFLVHSYIFGMTDEDFMFILQNDAVISFAKYMSYIPLFHALGDTIGYHNGHWEFNYGEINVKPEYTNEMIAEFISLGGVNDMSITGWMVSDDSIMYMATFSTLLNTYKSIDEFGKELKKQYLGIASKMANRHPGETTMSSLAILEGREWNDIPYNPMSLGSGSSMRTGCIGMFYPGTVNRNKLIALAVEASRITHNSAVAILGGITSALFTAYAIERVPINQWPHKLLKLMKGNKIDDYLKKSRPDEYQFYQRDKGVFIGKWEQYINFRFSGLTPRMDLKIMKNPVTRITYLAQKFSRIEKNFNPGSCADDSVIIAFDCLLEAGQSFEKLLVYSVLHPGDSDTVGCIAFSWFGANNINQKIYDTVGDRFKEIEDVNMIRRTVSLAYPRFVKTYYYDMYLHYGKKVAKKIIQSLGPGGIR